MFVVLGTFRRSLVDVVLMLTTHNASVNDRHSSCPNVPPQCCVVTYRKLSFNFSGHSLSLSMMSQISDILIWPCVTKVKIQIQYRVLSCSCVHYTITIPPSHHLMSTPYWSHPSWFHPPSSQALPVVFLKVNHK